MKMASLKEAKMPHLLKAKKKWLREGWGKRSIIKSNNSRSPKV